MEFGEDPNHISCHFGILFIFQNLLEEILKKDGISGIPVRNPILIFETPNKESNKNSAALSQAKKFFKGHSKMRECGKDKAKKWMTDSMDSALGVITQALTVKSRLQLLMEHDCPFPDYTLDSLYRRGPNDTQNWEGGLAKYLGMVPTFIPKFYENNSERVGGVVSELICHLGHGPIPNSVPEGIDISYFEGRKLELQRLIESKSLLRNTALNLVDFSFLDDSEFV